MTKWEIVKDIRKAYPCRGLLTMFEIRDYTGLSVPKTREFTADIPHIGNLKGKKFAIADIAEKLASEFKF
jgi:hypothetical protein